MRLFLDTSVLLAASGSSRGASRALFSYQPANAWTLVSSGYCVAETKRNVGKLPEPELGERAPIKNWARTKVYRNNLATNFLPFLASEPLFPASAPQEGSKGHAEDGQIADGTGVRLPRRELRSISGRPPARWWAGGSRPQTPRDPLPDQKAIAAAWKGRAVSTRRQVCRITSRGGSPGAVRCALGPVPSGAFGSALPARRRNWQETLRAAG